MINPSSQDPSISDFLRTVEAGQDIKDALIVWQRKNSGRLKVEELKKSLFAEEREERQSSGSLRSIDVLEAIEALKLSASKKFCRQRVRLSSLQHIYDAGTTLMPAVNTETGYHVVIEKNRPFTLSLTDSEMSTLDLMNMACNGCFTTKKHWPTCILVRVERFYKIECNLRWYMIEGVRIPFDCAPDDAQYDVMVVYDEVAQEDAWTQDRIA